MTSVPSAIPRRPALSLSNAWKAIAGLAAIVFALFADMLIAPGTHVLGNRAQDMFLQFFSWREFGFGQLAHGNLALWNPHVYAGAPYFGGSQAAMLYPTNVLLLFLPLPLAINWSIALNVWLLGVFMYVWAGFRGLKPLACFVGAVLVMFCGPHILHVYSGHPVHLASMTWVPLIFLAIDGVLSRGRDSSATHVGQWCLLGMFAVAMQILAGHPQYLFYTGIAAGTYVLVGALTTARAEKRGAFLRAVADPCAAVTAMFGGAAALAAIQLFTAVQAAGETIRSARVPFEFASMFGFPPENVLTLLSPYFFGDMLKQPYWGRWYLWETSLFMGVTGLALAVYGVLSTRTDDDRPRPKLPRRLSKKTLNDRTEAVPVSLEIPSRRRWIVVVMVLVTFLFALGVHTPLFGFLYAWVPGFDRFRGISKFSFQTAVFVALLAAIGFDRLLNKTRIERRLITAAGVTGGLLVLLAGYIRILSPENWREWLRVVGATGESYLKPAVMNDLGFASQARVFSSNALVIPGITLLIMAALLYMAPRWRRAMYLVTLLVVAETFVVARHSLDSFDSRDVVTPMVREFVAAHPGDYRSMNLVNPNSAMSIGAQDLWGFDPGVVRRYGEFMAWTQGIAPDEATQYVSFTHLDPLYTMLRLRYAFVPDQNGGTQVMDAPTPPMDRVQLVSRCRVIGSRDAIFSAMRGTDFDPRTEVILEEPPAIQPVASSDKSGGARVTASSTDWMEIEADTASPAILLITDPYTPAWRAVALPGSVQHQYDLRPANYVLRAVPLTAGHHYLRVEYAPRAFAVGKWVSICAWLVFLFATATTLLKRGGRE